MSSSSISAWVSSTYDSIPSISVPVLMERCADSLNQSANGQSPCDSTCVAVTNAVLSGLAGVGCGAKARALYAQGKIKTALAFGCLSLLTLGYAVTTTALFVMDKMYSPEKNTTGTNPPAETNPLSSCTGLTHYGHFNHVFPTKAPIPPQGCKVDYTNRSQQLFV